MPSNGRPYPDKDKLPRKPILDWVRNTRAERKANAEARAKSAVDPDGVQIRPKRK